MEGRDWTPGDVALPGVSALNSVTKRPCGLDKYPTAPTSTGEGSQRGSVTKRKTIVNMNDDSRTTCQIDDLRDG